MCRETKSLLIDDYFVRRRVLD
ncbi:hypothetical protein ACIOVC_22950, partial [Pseudomonas neuropathica]